MQNPKNDTDVLASGLISAASFSPISVKFPVSWCGHIPFAAWIINEINPGIFVELGTHTGNSYFSLCQSALKNSLNTKCYAVDTWIGDDHAGVYDDDVFTSVNTHNQEFYSGFSSLLRMTFDDALTYFSDESIHLLHIDGLHTYEAVKHDFITWLPKLAPGAVVMFHDINVRERDFGVWKLWEELQQIHTFNIEFTHSHGLGVLQIGNVSEDRILPLFKLNQVQKQSVLKYFSSLGNSMYENSDLILSHNERLQEIKRLNKQSIEKDNHIQNLERIIASQGVHLDEKDGHIQNLDSMLVNLEVQLTCLREVISSNNTELESLLASYSWLVTAPFRFLISRVQKYLPRGKLPDNSPIILDAERYLSQNPDVRQCGMDPFEHYINFGRHEGRLPALESFFIRNLKRLQLIIIVFPIALKQNGNISLFFTKIWAVFNREGLDGIRKRILVIYRQTIPSAELKYGRAGRVTYIDWINQYDLITDNLRSAMREKISNMKIKPLISIVMPTYNSNPEWLKQAIESVLRQIYPHWELCIADDASTDNEVQQILKQYANHDCRIKVIFRETNGHISAASNSALELVTGEWVALLDHDDLLTEHALFCVADAINADPTVELIYSDEDKINIAGNRYDPYFKSDWNPELFYSQNLISHLGIYRSSRVKDIGGFREGFEGAQDYDLALRYIEGIDTARIQHIARILYHWRAHENSTSSSLEAKPYGVIAGEKALNEHFARRGINVEVKSTAFGYRVCYPLPDNPPLVSIVIPTRNNIHLLKQCVESVLDKTSYPNYEILIIDNGSDEQDAISYFDKLKSESRVSITYDNRPFNYSSLNNTAIKKINGEYVLLMNNDIEVISGEWLSEMVSLSTQSGVGVVGAKLLYPDDTIQHGGVILGIGGVAGHAHKHLPRNLCGYFSRAQLIQTISAVTAACLLVRKDLYDLVGGLNESDLKIAFNDIDFCLRVRQAGYRNIWTPYAELYHHESASRGLEDTPEKKARFSAESRYMQEYWGGQLLKDPAYNPNLALDDEVYSLAWPPRIKQYC